MKQGIADAADVGDAPLGALFRRYGPFLKMFATYAQRFVETYDARAALEACVAGAAPAGASEEDAAVLAAVALDARVAGVDGAAVAYHLAAPVQRVTEYDKLLKELVESTPGDHADLPDARLAHAAVHVAIEHVDATLRTDQTFKRLLEIHGRCDSASRRGVESLLDAPSRLLVKEGSLEEVRGGRRPRPLAAFALSDRLLLATTLVSRGRFRTGEAAKPWKRRLAHDVPLEAVSRVAPAGDASFAVTALAGELSLVLRAATPDQRDEWVGLLRELCAKLRAGPAAPAATPDRFRRRPGAGAKQRSMSWAPKSMAAALSDPLARINSLVSSATKRRDRAGSAGSAAAAAGAPMPGRRRSGSADSVVSGLDSPRESFPGVEEQKGS